MQDNWADLPANKAELIQRIQRARADLEALIATLSEDDLARPGPDGGWAVQDHLAHLAEWRWKLLAMIHGRPGYEGLQIDAPTWQTAGLDGINAILYARNQGKDTQAILADFRQVHASVLDEITRMDEDSLRRAYDLTDPSDPRILLEGIAGNTYNHDREHQTWIKEILNRP